MILILIIELWYLVIAFWEVLMQHEPSFAYCTFTMSIMVSENEGSLGDLMQIFDDCFCFLSYNCYQILLEMMDWESKLFSWILSKPFKRYNLLTDRDYLKNEYNLAELFYLHIAVRTCYLLIVLYFPMMMMMMIQTHTVWDVRSVK